MRLWWPSQRISTAAQLAIAWVLRREEVTAAIVGARSKKQIEETVQAGEWELSGEDIAEIDGLIEEHVERIENL